MRLICLVVLVLSLQSHAGLSWESKSIRLTAAPEQSSADVEFFFQNSGSDTVVINEVKSSCGCTTAAIDKKVIGPDDHGSIKGHFNFGPREGLQQQRFEVCYADGKSDVLDLAVEIPAVYVLSTRVLNWSLRDGGLKTCHLINVTGDAVVVDSVQSSSPLFHAEIAEIIAGFEYDVKVSPKEGFKSGRSIISIATKPIRGGKPKTYRIYALIH